MDYKKLSVQFTNRLQQFDKTKLLKWLKKDNSRMCIVETPVDEDKELHIAQYRYTQANNLPDFTYTNCPKCKQTLRTGLMRNMTFNQALTHCQTTLITGCPNCGYSWCD